MMAGYEDVGDAHSAIFEGAGVMRVFEQTRCMGILMGRAGVADDAGDETGDGIYEDHRGNFAAGEDVIANGDFVGDESAYAFINAFVMSAEDGEVGMLRVCAGEVAIEYATLRRGQDEGRTLRGVGSENGFDGFKDGFRFHYHAATSAVRVIVGDVMFVVGIVADVVEVKLDESSVAGALEDAVVEYASEHAGEEG